MSPQIKLRIEHNQFLLNRALMHKDWRTWFDLLLRGAKLQNQADLEDNAQTHSL